MREWPIYGCSQLLLLIYGKIRLGKLLHPFQMEAGFTGLVCVIYLEIFVRLFSAFESGESL